MQLRRSAAAVIVALAASTVGLVFAGVALGSGSCEALAVEDGSDSVLDPDTGRIHLETVDGGWIEVDPADPSCAEHAGVRHALGHAIASHASVQGELCADVRDLVGRSVSRVRGLEMNRAAARRYLVAHCRAAGGGPVDPPARRVPTVVRARVVGDPRVGAPSEVAVDLGEDVGRVTLVACKTAGFDAGLCERGTWGVGSIVGTSGSVRFTPSDMDAGPRRYYLYACGAARECDGPFEGRFDVGPSR